MRPSTNKQTFVSGGHTFIVVTGSEGGVVLVVVFVIGVERRLREKSTAIAINTQSPLYTTPETVQHC